MLYRISLHLARCHEFPNGSTEHGYDFVAPLDTDDRLSVEEWKAVRSLCRVHRFWADEDDRIGYLVHRAGGPGGANWVFSYDQESRDDDEAGHHLAAHRFCVGEYISLRDPEGEEHTFVVADIRPALTGQPRNAAERVSTRPS